MSPLTASAFLRMAPMRLALSPSSSSSVRETRVTFSMISFTLPLVPPTVSARSWETTWMSAAILDSDSISLATLAASLTQVISRLSSGRSLSRGDGGEPSVASRSASGSRAEGYRLVRQALACSGMSFFTRRVRRARSPSRLMSVTSPTWMPATWTRLFQASPVTSSNTAVTT